MRSFAILAVAVSVGLAGCATSPKQALVGLNTSDPRYRTARCKAARAEAAAWNEHKDGKVVIGLLGNLVVPFAGTATTFAMDRLRDDERRELTEKVRAACTSDPLAAKQRVARR